MRYITVAAAFAIMFAPSVAVAQDDRLREMGSAVLSEQDANDDGMITITELIDFHDRLAPASDVNDDGFVDEDEFVAIDFGADSIAFESGQQDEYQQAKRDTFAEMDLNADGQLSREEFVTALADGLAAADADESGTLTQEELRGFALTQRALDVLR